VVGGSGWWCWWRHGWICLVAVLDPRIRFLGRPAPELGAGAGSKKGGSRLPFETALHGTLLSVSRGNRKVRR